MSAAPAWTWSPPRTWRGYNKHAAKAPLTKKVRDTQKCVPHFFAIAHRFCCLHSRTSQGRGSVRGEPLTGSPTRVQSPARRRPLLRSKSAAPKRKHHPDGWCFLFVTVHRFCCLHSRPPQGRGSVRGEPLTGSPTRVQSPARRRALLRSKSAAPKKKDTHVGVFLFWSRVRESNPP